MYAEEVYSRIKVNEDVEIKFNLDDQDEHDKYSKSQRKSKRSKVKRPICSETSIILFMLVFFACSCFVLMLYAPDMIDTVSIKLEEYTIIIDTYLPVRDENSSLIFQTITREDEKLKVGNVKTKDELDKEAEDEAYRLLQQADDERMKIAHAAMEKVNAKILLAIQERERKIRQQRKESARVRRTKLFDETIAEERQRLHESQSKMGHKRRPNSIFINGQEVILPEERPTHNTLRKDPHIHDEKKNNQGYGMNKRNRHLIEEKPLADNPVAVKQLIESAKEVFQSVSDKENIIEVQKKKGSLIEKNNNNKDDKIERESNGKLKLSLTDGLAAEGEGQVVKFAVPNAENMKLNSEQLIEIDNDHDMSMIEIARDQNAAEKTSLVNDLSRKKAKDLSVEDFDIKKINNAVEKEKDFRLGIVEMNYNPGQNIKILGNNDHNTDSNSLKDGDIIPVKVELDYNALSDVTNNKEEQKLSDDQQSLDVPEKAAISVEVSDDVPAKRFSENKINKDSTIIEVPYDSDNAEGNAAADDDEKKVAAVDNVDNKLDKHDDMLQQDNAVVVEPETQDDSIVDILTDLKDLNEAEAV